MEHYTENEHFIFEAIHDDNTNTDEMARADHGDILIPIPIFNTHDVLVARIPHHVLMDAINYYNDYAEVKSDNEALD